MEKERVIKYLITVLIILSFSLISFSLISSNELGRLRLNLFENENISYNPFVVEMRDGALIHGKIYVDKELGKYDNNSVPTILLLNGINSKKEDKLEMTVQFVKLGYAVIVVEQRGHGESHGPSAFLAKEPYDMVEIIDFMQLNYEYINYTHMGLLAFSYGGGIGAVLQAIDNRIYTSVLFHPLTSLSNLTRRIPFEDLIGTTPSIQDLETIEDAFDLAHPNNTDNLLIIQGLTDTLILPETNEAFYHHLNGTEREDIQIELRPNLNHFQNDADPISIKHSIIWIENFFHNQSLDILDRESEFGFYSLINFNYPTSIVPVLLLIISIIILFFSSTFYLLHFKVIPYWKNLPFSDEEDISRRYGIKYQKMLIYRSIIYLIPIFIIGPLFALINSSFIYGYFIAYPICSAIPLFFINSELNNNWKEEWKSKIKLSFIPSAYSLFVIIGIISLFLIIYNINARLSIEPIIPILNNSLPTYLLVGFSSIIMDSLYLRDLKHKHSYIIIGLRILSLLLFLIFIPLPPFPYLGGITTHFLFIILTGIMMFYLRQLINLLSKFFKTYLALIPLIILPLIIFFTHIFFRIV
ncbi:MAG: prolyl oligopeptidase family serine peptidase [Candidatus Lokiarchaeota archaeon]|nr:prolyl oligopeptidase family serine peptidase [Candidatus Lokiarchaeota archaeon]MBD3199735.1 prolyl oligopeptidase family serine peptidase [Candidatus Lokiarchaeota archaeon]